MAGDAIDTPPEQIAELRTLNTPPVFRFPATEVHEPRRTGPDTDCADEPTTSPPTVRQLPAPRGPSTIAAPSVVSDPITEQPDANTASLPTDKTPLIIESSLTLTPAPITSAPSARMSSDTVMPPRTDREDCVDDVISAPLTDRELPSRTND